MRDICQCHANSVIKLELINCLGTYCSAILTHLDRDLKCNDFALYLLWLQAL